MSLLFREALDGYIAEKARYDKAREDFGDNYDWGYYGHSSIEALERAEKRLDEAFTDAVRSVVEQPPAEADAHG